MTMTSVRDVDAPARGVALMAARRVTEVGTELLALCQPVDADGSLSGEEVAALRAWLDARSDDEDSSFSHLFCVVEECVATGRVTREACRTLFTAIAAVLPTDVRAIARSSRRTFEEKDAERYKLERDAHWQQPRDERERNRPVARLEFMVAGTRDQGRTSIIERFARSGDPVFLVREADNARSRHAIQVRIAGGMQLGFVPEEIASDIARLLDAGCRYQAEISRMLVGAEHPAPVLTVTLYRADSTVVDMVQPDEPLRDAESLPVAIEPRPADSAGNFWKVLLLVVAAFAIYKLLR